LALSGIAISNKGMPHISWSEVRDRAIRFSREWTGTSSESAEKQTFWNEFFEVFGLRRRSVATFEEVCQQNCQQTAVKKSVRVIAEFA